MSDALTQTKTQSSTTINLRITVMKPTFLFPVTPLFLHLLLARLLSLALAVLFLPVPPALADTFSPTLTIDLTDTNPGDSRCDALVDFIFPGDQCTLRAAIRETNALPRQRPARLGLLAHALILARWKQIAQFTWP
jgi:hypothetical protein